MTDSCNHDELEVGATVRPLNGPDGPWDEVVLRVRCGDCGTLFSFRGLNSGISNPLEPVVTADGYELHAPVHPQPGGVVAVLKLAGLEDELTEPAPSGGVSP